ncbi:LysR family transcriptional regulator [Pseudomaricurvus alkylphenolicus]|uniref:LysR family transcriptional regulator n=1 Tax=Pseudomaricurvus alkylphenolicus TaxID=1306991 RepID=UPI00141DA981|nr:LysR family transcriptional regulator [Pseudomaricurvus alkylphenolicus]NIB38838.1 LysR family transcriptional regulator [Pseudomaricurvus alkylphenolicus]
MYDQLSRIDLNLLIALQVLLEERNTTKAAERMFITQSAMSKTLNRLRQVFDDELFTRQGFGLKPTPKAEQLARPLQETLKTVYGMVHPTPFDPASARGVIHLGITEPTSICVVPALLQILEQQAPNVILASHNLVGDYRESLQSGLLDFYLYQLETGPELVSNKVGSLKPFCIMRKNHPLSDKEYIDWNELRTIRKVIYSLPNVGIETWSSYMKDAEVQEAQNHCALETTQLLLGIEVLLNSEAVMLGSIGMLDLVACGDKLTAKPIKNIPPEAETIDMYLTQHLRTLNLPLHQWFTEKIAEVAADTLR